ncbi:MAG TPA: Asp-tRNA(Asn)/Glu-tRNA(Gln) amidotransferase subunit GatB [Candidatus Dormibacteraeota bacterium]|nr:Asp-tRNA(Asn)/Glu-tRNA(Gln) amidotransferase subunit GatB [Candidatus Dormibacteraeota bacterium]
MSDASWEVVIGMEVHVQPRTRSKMFCGCAIAELNAPPNTHVCEVCLGLPGVLPVPNKAAIEACLKTALALNCDIPRHTKFDRKNYMYPDLPKGYQISQYDLPMSVNGVLELGERKVRIRRVHLEEDTGKLVHAGDKLHRAWESYVDLNRAGVPLMEIVSEPDIRSADEARDYAVELQTVLRTIGASNADMEKGQMRVEPNISIRRAGSGDLGVKTELKNINSFRALHRAIIYEVERQRQVLEGGGTVAQETRGWSEAEQRTFSQRSKEFAEDYRYFPEPDIPPLELDRAWIEDLRAALPEMPAVRRGRLAAQLSSRDAALIAADRELADLFERAVELGAPAAAVGGWIINEVAPSGKLPSPENLAELVKLVSAGDITRDQARVVLAESVETGRTPAEIVAEHGYAQVSDESELRVLAQAAIDANPKAAADYRSGKEQAANAILNDLRKKAPQANPKLAREVLLELLR